MSNLEDRSEQLYPCFTAEQIDLIRRFASSAPESVTEGAPVWRKGDDNVPAYLILSGELLVSGSTSAAIVRYRAGQISGEISQLSGRRAIVAGTAGPKGAELMAFDAMHLRALLIGSAEVGEMLMRSFILRRTLLLTKGGAGSVLIGDRSSTGLSELEGFLARNDHPYVNVDPEISDFVERLGLTRSDLPVVITPRGDVLKRPDIATLALAIGILPDLDLSSPYDVAIVGAGPAGLAAATYAASEGLHVIVLEAHSHGGQAGASARIENYLGFPTGITGQALMARAFIQAQKFGADVATPLSVTRLECEARSGPHDKPFILHLSDGRSALASTVVIASGARYRRPAIDDLARFEGAGVSYWASAIESRQCEGLEVAVVGAGNSAGQAVAYLAPKVSRLHLVVRGTTLEATMSRYLIERIAALPNVEIHLQTEVAGLKSDGAQGLESVNFIEKATLRTWTAPVRHVFLLIGAEPNSEWLGDCGVQVSRGFVATGQASSGSLETNIAGVFAIGDVRAGSTKRVAAAVGEGAQVVGQLHAALNAGPRFASL